MSKERVLGKPRTIDTARRVLLPSEVTEALGVDVGDFVVFVLDEAGHVHVRRCVWSLE